MSYPLTAILSDLHGNVPALETALDDARRRGVERYVCLGDVVGYGARPRPCLDVVMRLCVEAPEPLPPGPLGEWRGGSEAGVGTDAPEAARGGTRAADEETRLVEAEPGLAPGLCLLGNHEYALLHSAEDFNPRARAAIEWTKEELWRGGDEERSRAYWNFIGDLSPSETDGTAMFAHGSPRDPVREYMLPRDVHDEEKLRANFERMSAPVCFVGHSHVPAVYYEDRRFFQPRGTQGPYDLGDLDRARAIVNVGSIGQPRDGDPRACYALFDGQYITFVRLAYDLERAQADIRSVPELPDELAQRLAVGR